MRFDPAGLPSVELPLRDANWSISDRIVTSKSFISSFVDYENRPYSRYDKDHKIVIIEKDEINSNNFRSDEFTSSHDGKHVLFAGCSVSFGDGLFKEEVWAYKLYKKLSEQTKLSGYFNLSAQGIGAVEIFKNISIYIDRFGIPDVIFVLLPNLFRFIDYRDDRYFLTALNEWRYAENAALYKKALPIFYSQYLMLESLCRITDTKLYVSSTDHNVSDAISLLETQRFFGFDENKKFEHAYRYSKANPEDDHVLIARDLGEHPGTGIHDYYTQEFYRLYEDGL